MANGASVALLGYGRFGQAFANLCASAGLRVRAFDPTTEVPAPLRASSAADVTAGAQFIVVAVPLSRMEVALRDLAPHVGPEQIVLDVGSVKVLPSTTMEAVFGDRVPWVATHPLFGPASITRGEPLRVVVCPNRFHPAAVARVSELFRKLGCQVMPQPAEAHDQEMALTHAMTFFVAKGMMDTGVPVDAPHAPPSFQGVARAIEAVRADAGHLLVALHRFNPFASTARKRLLDALASVDRSLAQPEAGGEPSEAALQIPDLGSHSPELLETRELIDEVDEEIVSLLARRAELARRVGRVKAERGLGVTDPGRELKLLEARRKRATELGLDSASVEEIFQAILRFSRSLQR